METALIRVLTEQNEVFYHVTGDNCKYYDLEGIIFVHPELKNFIDRYRAKLHYSFSQSLDSLKRGD